ncbi:hypothetical protein HMPREF9628_01315 [Peptoanaerobacter stomatis]|uniref:Bacteriophage abortive infection protein AbiH n=1 Tax=Peptoanaerobacter stomatis TaxID=796937 RepID=G9XBE8_9FIRM|nr:AbiH family protein [Peptoanaerobacter stomatis]EHL19799.1 hypothetical protein HMPREF9628_01315 [Peptoanaerobacter stomatis]
MNILVIGNGFDLAHGLPTKYGDFLDFIAILGFKSIQNGITNFTLCEREKLVSNDESNTKKMEIIINQLNNIDIVKEPIKCILGFKEKAIENHDRSNTISYNNFWIEYFLKRRNKIGENWIDFEQEIADVLKKLEYNNNFYYKIFDEIKTFYDIKYGSPELNKIEEISKKAFGENNIDMVYIYNQPIQDGGGNTQNCLFIWNDIYNKTIGDIVKNLEKDLDNLILAFEIYLKEIVQNIPIQTMNINNIGQIDKVISFNYTNTFSKIYNNNNNVEVNYLHGKVREDLNNDTNNMVLGIDEYLPKETKSTNLTFVYFKKYFQRIYKKNGAKYKEWLIEPDIYTGNGQEGVDYYKDGNLKIAYNNVYFFGHSLAESDRDILRELIENEYTKIKIFYYNIESYGIQIQNLIRIIGQDKLLEYTYRENKKIEFIE